MDIEKVAARDARRRSSRVHVDPVVGLAAYQARELALRPRPRSTARTRSASSSSCMRRALRRSSSKEDCSLLEVNPLVVTKNGDVVALDAQDQLRRQRRVPPPRVERAARHGRRRPGRARGEAGRPQLRLARRRHRLPRQRRRPRDGDDGHHQARTAAAPANFLDVGGGATQEQVTKAFQMILRSPKVKGDLRQHLRRHHEVRRHRRGRRRRDQGARPQGAARRAARRDERRARAQDPDESGLAIQAARRWPTARRRSSPRSWRRGAKS